MNKYKRGLCAFEAVSHCPCSLGETCSFPCFFRGPDLGAGSSAFHQGSPWECVWLYPIAWPFPRGGDGHGINRKLLCNHVKFTVMSGKRSSSHQLNDGKEPLHFRPFTWAWSWCQRTIVHSLLSQGTAWVSWPNVCPLGITLLRKACLGTCLQKPAAPGKHVARSAPSNPPCIFQLLSFASWPLGYHWCVWATRSLTPEYSLFLWTELDLISSELLLVSCFLFTPLHLLSDYL